MGETDIVLSVLVVVEVEVEVDSNDGDELVGEIAVVNLVKRLGLVGLRCLNATEIEKEGTVVDIRVAMGIGRNFKLWNLDEVMGNRNSILTQWYSLRFYLILRFSFHYLYYFGEKYFWLHKRITKFVLF